MKLTIYCFILLAVPCVYGRSYKEALVKIKHIIDAFSSLGKNKRCESGWTRYQDHCYLISSDRRTWHDSEEYCRRRDSYMVKVDNIQENNWIISKLHSINVPHNLWLGGNDLERENHWVWSVDSTPISYLPWLQGEPNGGTRESCLEVFGKGHPKFGKWNDTSCYSSLHAICEREMI